MKILWNNTAVDATLSATTEDSDYPVENIQDVRTKKVFRSTDDAAERIVFAGTATASYCVIINHNFSSSATIKIEGNDSDSWGSPSLSETMTYNSGMIVKSFTEATYDYWSIYVDDNNSDGYIEIGFVFIGTYLRMPKMKRDQSIPKSVNSYQQVGQGGQVFGGINYHYREFDVNFKFLTNTQRHNIVSMFSTVGDVTPIILIPWTDRDFENYMYAIINQKTINFERTDSQNYPWETNMKFREVV